MALNKIYELQNGVSVSYWNIGELKITKENNVATIVMNGYIDETIRNQGKERYCQKEILVDNSDNGFDTYFSLSKLDATTKNIYQLAYEYLKENEAFFQGAEDILE